MVHIPRDMIFVREITNSGMLVIYLFNVSLITLGYGAHTIKFSIVSRKFYYRKSHTISANYKSVTV